MLQLDQVALLAADDWIQLLGGIIFMALYGLQQFLTGRGEDKAKPKKPRRPKQPAGQPEMGQQAAGMRPADQADPLRAEVDQFLRQAEQKQKPEPRPAPLAPLTEVERPRKIDTPKRERKRPKSPRVTPREEERGPAQRSEDISQHVERHLSTKEYEQRAKHLGEEVALADDKLEARLEKTFDHRLGKLGQTEMQPQEPSAAEAATSSASIAEEIRQLLSQPQGMRQVIVANEILRRPEERW